MLWFCMRSWEMRSIIRGMKIPRQADMLASHSFTILISHVIRLMWEVYFTVT